MMKQTSKKMTVNDFVESVDKEEKFIKKLREQQKDKQETEENRKTFHKCLQRLLKKNHCTHQLLSEAVQKLHEEVCRLFTISRVLEIMKFSFSRRITTLTLLQESTISLEIHAPSHCEKMNNRNKKSKLKISVHPAGTIAE